jgi:hypothetical protein
MYVNLHPIPEVTIENSILLQDLPTSGTASLINGALTLKGAGLGVEVFHITEEQLEGASGYNIILCTI